MLWNIKYIISLINVVEVKEKSKSKYSSKVPVPVSGTVYRAGNH